MKSYLLILFTVLALLSLPVLAQHSITIDGDMLDWAAISAADVGQVAEELGDMPNGAEFDLQDMYVASDDSTVFFRIVIDPSAELSTQFITDPFGEPAFQLFIDANFGDTTGLGYGGFWITAPEYLIDLAGAYHPTEPVNEVTIYYYPYDYNGAFEDWDSVGVAQIAVSAAGNELEVGVPKDVINAGTDIRPFVYSVRTDDWDNEEYMPNDQAEGEQTDYYAINYNFFTGPSVVKVRGEIMTGIEDSDAISLPIGFDLSQNYPNPFNPSTTIEFFVPQSEKIELNILNILGQKVRTLNNGTVTAGTHQISWDGKNDDGRLVSSGVYLYQLKTSAGAITKKMLFIQ